MVKKLSLYMIVALTLVGCRPEGILHSWEMRDIFVDLHKTDALLQEKGLNYNQEVKAIYYAQVLADHKVTQAQFDSSLVWYTAHPQLFDKIYPKVIAQLKKEQDAFLELHPEFAEVADSGEGLRVTGDSAHVFSRRDLDSILLVTQHGYFSSWNTMAPDTSVHDLVDQFFPQIGVLRGGVVDTLQTSVEIP